jgi:uncharacterized membrane protein
MSRSRESARVSWALPVDCGEPEATAVAGEQARTTRPQVKEVLNPLTTSNVHPWIEAASVAIESLAVAIIVLSIAYATIVYLLQILNIRHPWGAETFVGYKIALGRALQLGLEILVAADVVRTVALDPTLKNVGILGILVVIRTFLSWSLFVELQGRWPWESGAGTDDVPDTRQL